jgi:hypothetical protein
MNTPDHQPINEKVRNALSKLKGVEFHGPEELAEFLKKEDVRFSAHDLICFGRRAAKAKVVISTHFNSKQQVFLLFVLSHYYFPARPLCAYSAIAPTGPADLSLTSPQTFFAARRLA